MSHSVVSFTLFKNKAFSIRKKTEIIAANTKNMQFCERTLMVIRFPAFFPQSLHETTDSYIKLRNDS
jgi:hypothetical protein